MSLGELHANDDCMLINDDQDEVRALVSVRFHLGLRILQTSFLYLDWVTNIKDSWFRVCAWSSVLLTAFCMKKPGGSVQPSREESIHPGGPTILWHRSPKGQFCLVAGLLHVTDSVISRKGAVTWRRMLKSLLMARRSQGHVILLEVPWALTQSHLVVGGQSALEFVITIFFRDSRWCPIDGTTVWVRYDHSQNKTCLEAWLTSRMYCWGSKIMPCLYWVGV